MSESLTESARVEVLSSWLFSAASLEGLGTRPEADELTILSENLPFALIEM
jgi:hypothetical protein